AHDTMRHACFQPEPKRRKRPCLPNRAIPHKMKKTDAPRPLEERQTVLKRAFLAATIWMVGTAGAFAAPVDLTILHTNDTHDRLLPFDSRNGKDLGGIARRAALIKQIKAQTAGTLVLDAGDVFQGTPIYTFYLGEADYKAMEQAG